MYKLCDDCERLICELDDCIGDHCELNIPLMEDSDCPYDCSDSNYDCFPCCKAFERR